MNHPVAGHAAGHHDELVTTQTPGLGGVSEGLVQLFGHLAQQPVADLVAVEVVHDLEAVHVDEHHRHLLAGPLDGLVGAFGDGPAVRQTRERVVGGQAHRLVQLVAHARELQGQAFHGVTHLGGFQLRAGRVQGGVAHG